MKDPQVGWIAAIIIGGIAGWLAEQFMKSQMGLLMNIILGIIGAAIGSAILTFFGINLGGWIGYLIAGFVGAVLLIWIVRM
ncbi:MAG: GlsB/YeaQ/YmgE family stress response membrane protein, partial [Pseudolabrys sp.]